MQGNFITKSPPGFTPNTLLKMGARMLFKSAPGQAAHMGQDGILEALDKEGTEILQPLLWEKYPDVGRDSTALNAIRFKGFAKRQEVMVGKRSTYKWNITKEGRDYLRERQKTKITFRP